MAQPRQQGREVASAATCPEIEAGLARILAPLSTIEIWTESRKVAARCELLCQAKCCSTASAIMSQQVLKAAAPVLKRMPLAALLSGQVCCAAADKLFCSGSGLKLKLLAGAVHRRGPASKAPRG